MVGRLIDESTELELNYKESTAIEDTQSALDLAIAAGNPDGIASAKIRLGEIHYRMGHFAEAAGLGEEVLSLAGRAARARVEAYLLLGNCSMEVGPLEQAEDYYQAAADLSRQIGYDHALIRALHDLGACIYAMRGQFDLAFKAEEEAYRLGCRVNSTLLPFMLISMCFACLLTGQFERTGELIQRLVPLIADNYRFQGYVDLLYAYLSQFEGNYPAALEHYNRASPVAAATGDLGLNVFLRIGLSEYYQITGNYPSAYNWASDAVAWAGRMGTQRLLGRALTERGMSAWLRADLTAAQEDLCTAIEILRKRHQAYDLARAQLLLAALRLQQSQPAAEQAYIEAVTLTLSGGFMYLLERERVRIFPLIAHYLNSTDASMQAINGRLLAQFMGVPPPPLSIVTLGGFEVYQRGRLIPNSAWRRQAGELFRLLLTCPGRKLPREQVVESLWLDKTPSAARVNFHQATSSLRRALEPDLPDKFPSRYLLVEEGQVALFLPIGSQVDYEAFEVCVNHAAWEQALKLYRGEPFAKDRYHDWASWKREELIQLGLKALLGAAAKKLAAGKPEQALAYSLQVLKEEPWNERAGLLGMQANLMMNNRPAAIRLYMSLERCLQEEFNLSPMPELRNLFQSIESQK